LNGILNNIDTHTIEIFIQIIELFLD